MAASGNDRVRGVLWWGCGVWLLALGAGPASAGFDAPAAAVKEPRLAFEVLRGPLPDEHTAVGAAYVGGRFALAHGPGGSVIEIAPGIAAQFDLEGPSMELVNADYRVGFALGRAGPAWEGRLELYHQSSHLGDEYLLRTGAERENLNFEALELLIGRRVEAVRVYGGLDAVLQGKPEHLSRRHWVLGAEWRPPVWYGTQPIIAWHGTRERSGAHGTDSVRVGLEVPPAGPRRLPLRAALVYYRGNSPFGQFFNQRVRYYGLALELVH